MSTVYIPYIPAQVMEAGNPTEDISAILNRHNRHTLTPAQWCANAAGVKTEFSIAYTDEHLLVKYYVSEPEVKAAYSLTNDPVYKDSCVELFIAFNDDDAYYNLEFNCAGTCLAQYGTNRTDRKFLPVNVLSDIRHMTTVKALAEGNIGWELTLIIPAAMFIHHPQLELSAGSARINAYKCGDDLQQPHYLCWGQIDSAEPDFHLSRFFKAVRFVSGDNVRNDLYQLN